MGQRRRDETTIAARGAVGQPRSLEHDHARSPVVLQGLQRRPQPGEPSPDDREVNVVPAQCRATAVGEHRAARRAVWTVGPEHCGRGIGE
ncbi:MAG: hypothetical protein V9F00_11255 [Nocardioides sp.]